MCGHSWKLIVTVTASDPPPSNLLLRSIGVRPVVSRSTQLTRAFELGMQRERLGGRGQKPICVARTNYAC